MNEKSLILIIRAEAEATHTHTHDAVSLWLLFCQKHTVVPDRTWTLSALRVVCCLDAHFSSFFALSSEHKWRLCSQQHGKPSKPQEVKGQDRVGRAATCVAVLSGKGPRPSVLTSKSTS